MSHSLRSDSKTSIRHAFSNLQRVFTGNVVGGLANMLSAVWLARELGPRVMGDYAALLVSLQLLAAFLTPGFNQAVIREPDKKGLAAAATLATFVQSVILVAASGIFLAWWSWYRPEALAGLYLPSAILLAGHVLSFWMYLLAVPFEAGLNYHYLVNTRLAAIAVGIVAAVAAAEVGLGVYALVYRDAAMSVVTFWLVRRRSTFQLAWHGWRDGMGDLLRFAKGMWGLNMMERVVLRIDYALVGILFEKEVLGVYFAVRGLVEGGLAFAVSPIQTVVYSFYCRATDIWNVVKRWLWKGGAVAGVAALVSMATAQGTGASLVALCLGARYGEGAALLGGLALYAFAVAWFENMKVFAMSQNFHRVMIVPRLLQLGVAVALTYPLIQLAGFAGAGLAAGLSALCLAAVATWLVARRCVERSAEPGFTSAAIKTAA